MDVLGAVLDSLRLASTVISRAELTSPWGIEKGQLPHASFHFVVRGPCWLRVGEESRPLAGGDLVVLPHGHPHALADSATTPTLSVEQVMAGATMTGKPMVFRYGGGGTPTTIVSGHFIFRDRRRNPLLTALPPLLHVRGEDGRAVPWLDTTLHYLPAETASGQPGVQAVVTRLADILFIQAVRAWLMLRPEATPGWLNGIGDPVVGAVLSLIHQRPAEPWTIERLAGAVDVSRSTLAARFQGIVGEPPIEYLTGWRMHEAAGMLADTPDPLCDIAARVGYKSEVAFSKAFKRWAGVPPGQYRAEPKLLPSPARP